MGLGHHGRASARPTRLFFLAVAASCALLSPSLAQSQNVTGEGGVRANAALGGDVKRTRFVIGVESAVQYQTFSLADPDRIVVELPDVKMQLPVMPTGTPVGLVHSFRGGLAAPGRARIVIDTLAPATVEASMEKNRDGRGARLVLDITPVDAQIKATRKATIGKPIALGLGAQGVQPPSPTVALPRARQVTKVYKPLIVIDPGHGGHDSGAQKFGTVEKDVVLAFSHRLREKLLETGRYRVMMTRETDVYVDLDERREFGDRNKAALFIAVHADYASTSARGATIYSLREGTAKDLQRSAKGEVTEDVLSTRELDGIRRNEGDVSAVRNILADLAMREVAVNKERSNLFTRSVIEYMGASTDLMANPDREANFRVLKSAKTPSVLIELAYVTNRQDAQNLKSDQWRDRVSSSILTAIENYFSHQTARLPM